MKSLVVLACLAVVTLAAQAQTPHYLDLFFKVDTSDWGTIPVTVPPADPVGPLTLAAPTDAWLALWGKSAGYWHQFTTTYRVGPSVKTWVYKDWVGDVWNLFSVGVVDSGNVLDETSSYCDNPYTVTGAPPGRWDVGQICTWSDFVPSNTCSLHATSTRGIGGAALESTGHVDGAPAVFDAEQVANVTPAQLDTPGFLYTIIGYAHIDAPTQPHELYLKIGADGIARRNGSPSDDYVRFGTSTPVLGATFGALGDQPMLVVIGSGDLNCDGVVNGQDIDGFVLALFDPAGYAVQYPACHRLNADMNGDGLVNGQDIDGFVAVLFGG